MHKHACPKRAETSHSERSLAEPAVPRQSALAISGPMLPIQSKPAEHDLDAPHQAVLRHRSPRRPRLDRPNDAAPHIAHLASTVDDGPRIAGLASPGRTSPSIANPFRPSPGSTQPAAPSQAGSHFALRAYPVRASPPMRVYTTPCRRWRSRSSPRHAGLSKPCRALHMKCRAEMIRSQPSLPCSSFPPLAQAQLLSDTRDHACVAGPCSAFDAEP